MDFNAATLDHSNAGQLFDSNGPSSLGSLPRAEVVVRRDVYREYFTSPVQQKQFPIGAITRTPPISTETLDRGRVELRRRQQPRRHSIMEETSTIQEFTETSMRNIRLSNSYVSDTEKAGERDFEYRATNVVTADVAAPPKPSGRPAPPAAATNSRPLFTNANAQSNGTVDAISPPNAGPSQLPADQGMLTPPPSSQANGRGNSSGIV